LQQDLYFIFSNIVGAAGIIGAIVAYLIAKRKIDSIKGPDKEESIMFSNLLKAKMKDGLNLSLAIVYIIIMIFTLVALPFIINPDNLREAWILVGSYGILGLGTPYTFITLIVIFRSELVEMKTIFPKGEPLISWFNYGLLLLALTLPLVWMTLMIVLRKTMTKMKLWKKILLLFFLVSILSTWLFISIWSYRIR
jgi:hypothetical protein